MNDKVIKRLENLRSRLREKGLDCLLISQADNRRYLSGFAGSAGALLISAQRTILATDFRYIEQSKIQAPLFEVIQIKGEIANWLPGLIASLNINSLGFEADDIPYGAYSQLADAISKGPSVKLIPTQGIVVELRARKDTYEIKIIRQAVALADEAFSYLKGSLRPGLSETAVAWELEKFLREKGSESMPFDIIIASGPNAALPHHHPTGRLIQAGEPIVVDLGARIDNYASDLTRTFCLGTPDAIYIKVYETVLQAQQNAIINVKPGMTGTQVDALSRSIIEEAGYGNDFGHGLGHGIGGAVHEEPRLGPGSLTSIQIEMAFTIEPGIYLPGWGGVRIEDDVYLSADGPQILSRSSRNLCVGLDNSIIRL